MFKIRRGSREYDDLNNESIPAWKSSRTTSEICDDYIELVNRVSMAPDSANAERVAEVHAPLPARFMPAARLLASRTRRARHRKKCGALSEGEGSVKCPWLRPMCTSAAAGDVYPSTVVPAPVR